MLASFLTDPEIWVHDYPPDIQEAWGEKSAQAKKLSLLFGIPFMGILFGGVVWSNVCLRRANGGTLSFKDGFRNAYALLFSFWAYDLLIMDWLVFVTLKPKFAILPGTEGMAGYDDYAFHLRVSWPFIFFMALPAALIAGLTTRNAT